MVEQSIPDRLHEENRNYKSGSKKKGEVAG